MNYKMYALFSAEKEGEAMKQSFISSQLYISALVNKSNIPAKEVAAPKVAVK